MNVTMMINQLMRADPHVPDTIYDNFEFIDDISGKKLDRDKAIEARRLEMKFFRKIGVYEKVPKWRATQDGCKVISTRWLDVNKGDEGCPNERARLVGREIKMDTRLDLFAATPPLESLRAM